MKKLWWVVNADQRGSRRMPDRVRAALQVLPSMTLGFERTAGDEVQGLTDSPAVVVEVLEALSRLDAPQVVLDFGWRIGIGLGPVEDPAVLSTREARGPAYIAAREAVDTTGRSPARLVVRGAPGTDPEAVERAETALMLLRNVLGRRSEKGWEVVDLMADLGQQSVVADRLGISDSAVSQRLDRAEWRYGLRGAELARHLLAVAQEGVSGSESGGSGIGGSGKGEE